LLSEHLPLDPFDSMLREQNDAVSTQAFTGRIVLHVRLLFSFSDCPFCLSPLLCVYDPHSHDVCVQCLSEALLDLFPSFCYNTHTARFIPSPTAKSEIGRGPRPATNLPFLYGNEDLSRAFFSINNRFRDFFGLEHAAALVRVVGPSQLPLLVRECLVALEEKITGTLPPYFRCVSLFL
jgi:hypothetical protein